MSLAATQQVSSAVSPGTPVNEPLFAPLHVNVNYGGTKKRCLPFTVSQVYFHERNSWKGPGFQSWGHKWNPHFVQKCLSHRGCI